MPIVTHRSTYGMSPAPSDYLSSLQRGTFGTRLSAKIMPTKAETPVQNKTAMSDSGSLKTYVTLHSQAAMPLSFYLGRFPYSASDNDWSLGVLNAFMPRRLRQGSTVRGGNIRDGGRTLKHQMRPYYTSEDQPGRQIIVRG